MYYSEKSENEFSDTCSLRTESSTSIDLLSKRPLQGKTMRFIDCELKNELNYLVSPKKCCNSLSKTHPTWKVNRKQSLVQWLQRESPLKKRKSTSSHYFVQSPKRKTKKSCAKLKDELKSSYGSENKKQFCQVQQVYPVLIQPNVKTNKIFPFKQTPSGNYTLDPKQVVYESNNLSIVAADPENITLKVNDSSKTLEKKVDKKENLPTTCLFTTVGNNIPMGSEFSDTGESDSGVIFSKIKSALPSEISLAKMGYVKENEIQWEKFNFPKKSDLQNLILDHIVNVMNPDTKVIIGEKTYNCHKIVLQCYCSYFLTNASVEVELPENCVTKEAFQLIYKWMLYLKPDSFRLLKREIVLEIFQASKFLGLKELEDQCWAFIDNLEVFFEDKAFLLYLDAKKHGDKDIMELMVPRVQRFFLTLVSSKEFVEMTCEEVCTFLRSNYICIHCEMEVFLSAIRWLSHDWSQRETHVVSVMGCVRFGLIDPLALLTLMRNPQSPEYLRISTVLEVAKMIEDGMAFNILKVSQDEAKQLETFQSLNLTKPVPRNWAGTEKTYTTYQEFLQDLAYYRSKHKLEIKQSKMKMVLDKVTEDDFLNTAITSTNAEEKIKKIQSSQSVKLAPREMDVLKKLISKEESLQSKSKQSKFIKTQIYCMAEDNYLQSCKNKPMNIPTPVSIQDMDKAARKIQKAFRTYSKRNVRAGADSGKSINALVKSKSDPSLPLGASQTFSAGPRTGLVESIQLHFGQETIYIFGGSNPFEEDPVNFGQKVFGYERGQNMWRKVAEMPEPRHYHGVIYYDGKLYVAGGKHPLRHPRDHGAISRKMWTFDPDYRGWSRLNDMPHARRAFNFMALNGRLYAVGGRDENDNVLNNVDAYDLLEDCWYSVKSMNLPRAGAAACEYLGKLWVAGGLIDKRNTPTNTTECYTPKSNEWLVISPLRYTLAYGVMLVVNDRLYIVGGAVGLLQSGLTGSGRQIDVWDPEINGWCLASMMHRPRHAHAAAYLKPEPGRNPGLVFILGGMMSKHECVTRDLECWLEEDNSWLVDVAPLPDPLSGAMATVMPTGLMG